VCCVPILCEDVVSLLLNHAHSGEDCVFVVDSISERCELPPLEELSFEERVCYLVCGEEAH
jgi:hypothetical protein